MSHNIYCATLRNHFFLFGFYWSVFLYRPYYMRLVFVGGARVGWSTAENPVPYSYIFH